MHVVVVFDDDNDVNDESGFEAIVGDRVQGIVCELLMNDAAVTAYT